MAKPSSRRSFLKSAGVATAAGALPATAGAEQSEESEEPDQAEITPATIAEAEKLAAVVFTDAEREAIHKGIGEQVARYVGRRAQALPNGLAPATIFDPRMIDTGVHASQRPIVRSEGDPGPLPARETDIAFAPVTALARWIERQELTSTRLTRIYLDRLRSFGPKLECVVTLTERLAMAQAERADREIAAGRYRGPLHGIPWGAKDLLDTAGIVTTWGATPYKDRVAEGDAAVVRRLEEAGAVLPRREADARGAHIRRHLVRWPDRQPLGSRAGLARLECRFRRRHGCRSGGLQPRHGDAGFHRLAVHALRHDRPATHIRPRGPHRRHGLVLVA
jgi:hypothetical protein